MISLPLRPEIIQAACDGVYLLDRGYPKESVINFVANHFVLLKEERNLIYRGICASKTAKNTKKKVLTSLDSNFLSKINSVGIDGFNLLITYETILKGEPVIYCYDSLIRDISAIHRKYKQTQWTSEGIESICDVLHRNLSENIINIYLDQVISKSGQIAAHIRDNLKKKKINGEVFCCKSPDHEVLKNDLIISHDSWVVQNAQHILDLPYILLKESKIINTPQIVNLREEIRQYWQRIQDNIFQ
ncbi:MAG: DUF434 domain-containing protein [Promethearchaeota archaeon]